jgi:hypothetical protein
MTRFLVHVLPLLLPFAIYAGYVWYVRRQKAHHPGWSEAPWTWLVISALLLLILSFLALGLFTGEPPSGAYTPPRLIDGKIAPGEIGK